MAPRDPRPGRSATWITAAVVAVAVAVAALGLGACARSSEAEPAVSVVDAYTIPGEGSLAIYLTLANEGGGDHIVGAALSGPDEGRAERISLHRTVERDGLATMTPTDRLPVPGGTDTALEPGGGHLMVEGLVDPVELGDTFELTVELERSGPLEATVEVIDVDEALARLVGDEGAGS